MSFMINLTLEGDLEGSGRLSLRFEPQIKVRNMKSIWGSCTTTGSAIRLNLQLMKADEACIEQVILHELLHFRYPNHGKSFYDLLEQLMPDWKERKERLEKNFKDGV